LQRSQRSERRKWKDMPGEGDKAVEDGKWSLLMMQSPSIATNASHIFFTRDQGIFFKNDKNKPLN